MSSRHDHDAVLHQIAAGLAGDDRRLARWMAVGPTYPLRRIRRWCGLAVAAALTVAVAGALASSVVTGAIAATIALLALMTAVGLSIVVWSADRHAAVVLRTSAPWPAIEEDV